MKVVEESKKKNKKKQTHKPKKEHVLVVAQEIKFARLLSGNEKKSRDRVLKTLKKWLINCFQKDYEFKEDDFIRVWKGLFYAVWMSDKPLIQEDLCESIAEILDQFPKEQFRHCLLMVKAGFKVLATEWFGIDYHRIDKYLMLVRRYLRGSLRCLHRMEWSLESCQMYSKILNSSDGLLALKTPHYARNALSMVLHIVDCFLEELSKVSDGKIPEDSLVELLRPFCGYTTGGEVLTVCIACRRLLTALVRQSELGLQYNEATSAWKRMGCPKGGPEALELVSDDDESNDGFENGSDAPLDVEDEPREKPLDPRAGRVDVELQPLPVPAGKLAELLREMLAHASSKAHRRVKICMERFEKLARNEYPLPVATSETVRDYGPRVSKQRSIKALTSLEKNLVAASDELALRGLNRKHRKRLLAKSRSGASIVDDVERIKQKQSVTNTTNGDWQVEATEPQTKKHEQDTSDKKIKPKQSNKREKEKKARKRKLTTPTNDTESVKKLKVTDKDKMTNKVTENENADVTQNNEERRRIKENKEVRRKVKKTGLHLSNGKIVADKITEIKKLKEENVEPKNMVKTRQVNAEKQEDKAKKADVGIKAVNKIKDKKPTLLVNKVKNFQKSIKTDSDKVSGGPKKVKFALKNNCMQGPVEYYKSVRQSPSIPFDSRKRPSKTNLKPSTPSPINPFLKKKMRIKY